MSYLIIGASAGVGRAIAHELAKRGKNLILVASSEEDLKATASDLALRFNVRVVYLAWNLALEPDGEAFYQKCFALADRIEGILFTAGCVSDSDRGQLEENELTQLVNVNFKSVLAICNRFIPYFQRQNAGVLVAFSSIAAARGRRNNIVYGAMKRALEAYFEGLRSLFASGKVRVQVYRLGYIETQMSFGRNLLFPVAKPESAAKTVCGNLEKDIGIKYFPGFWKWIIFILQRVPWFIFKKLEF